MADNQREMSRREKKAKKDKRNKIIIWIIIAVIILILAVMKICEININSVKDRFTDENGSFTLSDGVTEDNFPYALDSSKNVTIKNVNKKIGVLTPLSFTVIDSGDGEEEYSFIHGYSNPILKASGVYTLIYDQGAQSMRLDTTSGCIYETQAKRNIFCADVAKNGSVVYAVTSKEKKCDVCVYSKSLKEQMCFSTSDGFVTAAAINDSAKKIAFVAVDSENAQLKSTLYTMNVGSDEITAQLELPQGNVIELEYSSDNIYVIGDTFLCTVSNQKDMTVVYEQGSVNTVSYTYTPSSELVYVYNGYNNSSDNTVARVKPNGKIRCETKVAGTVKSVSASSNALTVLTGSEIISYKLSNLEQTGTAAADDSCKAVCRMGSEVFVHRQSLLDRNGDEAA